MTEASASVCLILATALQSFILRHNNNNINNNNNNNDKTITLGAIPKNIFKKGT